MATTHNSAVGGKTTSNRTNKAIQPVKAETPKYVSPVITLPDELADWLSHDLPRIRQSKGHLRSWFMAFMQTDLAGEMGAYEKSQMIWFYEMLDELFCDCLETEAVRATLEKGGEK